MTTAALSHKEMVAHIRKRIKVAGIKACCKMETFCGEKVVKVYTPTYESRFTSEEIREFTTIAKINRLTAARGMEINPEHESQLTEKTEWKFYL